MTRKGCAIYALVFFAVVGSIAGAFWWYRPAPTFEVIRPQRRLVVELVIASGKLRPARQSELGIEVTGLVDRVAIQDGDKVKAGQVLVALRDEDVKLQLEKARRTFESSRAELERVKHPAYPEDVDRTRADLERDRAIRKQAEVDHERAKKMSVGNAITPTELDSYRLALEKSIAAERATDAALRSLLSKPRAEDVAVAEAKLKQDEAAVRVAEQELRKRQLLAPADGVVTRRVVEPGQVVRPGDPLLTLAFTDTLEIYLETDENNLSKLALGQKARAFPPAYADKPFEARIVQIGPCVDNARGVVGVKLKPTEIPGYALLDMTVDVNIEVARLENALAIPAPALHQEGRQTWVILQREDGKRERRDVVVLGRSPDWVAVSGIDDNAPVVFEKPNTGAIVPFRPM